MKLNRKSLRKLILKEMRILAEMGPDTIEPMDMGDATGVSSSNPEGLRLNGKKITLFKSSKDISSERKNNLILHIEDTAGKGSVKITSKHPFRAQKDDHTAGKKFINAPKSLEEADDGYVMFIQPFGEPVIVQPTQSNQSFQLLPTKTAVNKWKSGAKIFVPGTN